MVLLCAVRVIDRVRARRAKVAEIYLLVGPVRRACGTRESLGQILIPLLWLR
jgi:hypothetical protein